MIILWGDYSTGGGEEASGVFWWVWEFGWVGRFGASVDGCVGWGSVGLVGLCVGTQSVFEIYLNRPRVGGSHGVCENFSLLTAPCVLLFAKRFVNQLPHRVST